MRQRYVAKIVVGTGPTTTTYYWAGHLHPTNVFKQIQAQVLPMVHYIRESTEYVDIYLVKEHQGIDVKKEYERERALRGEPVKKRQPKPRPMPSGQQKLL